MNKQVVEVNWNLLGTDVMWIIIQCMPLYKLRCIARCKCERAQQVMQYLCMNMFIFTLDLAIKIPHSPTGIDDTYFAYAILNSDIKTIDYICGLGFMGANKIMKLLPIGLLDKFTMFSSTVDFPLLISAVSGRVDSINALIDSGADLSNPIYKSNNIDISVILDIVVDSKLKVDEKVKVIEALLKNFKIPKVVRRDVFYSLHKMDKKDRLEVVIAIEKYGWNLGQQTSYFPTTYESILKDCNIQKHREVLDMILDHEKTLGIDVTKYKQKKPDECRSYDGAIGVVHSNGDMFFDERPKPIVFSVAHYYRPKFSEEN